jgi:hypothetical protein
MRNDELELLGIYRQLTERQQRAARDFLREKVRRNESALEGLKPTPAHMAADDARFQIFMRELGTRVW